MALIYFTVAWVAGIVFSYYTAPTASVPLALLGGATLGIWLYAHDKQARLFYFSLAFLGLGILRFNAVRADQTTNTLHLLNDRGGQMTLEGQVVSEPQKRDNGLRIVLEAHQAGGHPVEGRVLVTLPRYSEVNYGDNLRLFGYLNTPPEFDTFSYSDYLARQAVFSVMFQADIVEITPPRQTAPLGALFALKMDARRFINQHLPEPQAALLVGILLGDESGIPEETEQAFIVTGTSHVIAISGFNMVILAQVIMSILEKMLPKKGAAVLGISAIMIYTIFVGASGSVVRAAVMSSLLIIAQTLNRRTYVPASLAFAALLMSLLNPWVLWDIGFQLSFAAVVGMALFVKPIEHAIQRGLQKIASQNTTRQLLGLLSEGFIVTFAAQVTTTPLILYYFGRLSIVSLVVNFLILPIQAPLLLFGAVGVMIGLVIPSLGGFILTITWLFLTWTVTVVNYFSQVSWADAEVHVSQELIVGFFACLGVMMWYQGVRPRWAERLTAKPVARLLQAGALLMLLLLLSLAFQKPDAKLHVTFLDVNGSNGILIETPRGATILVDGGEMPSRLLKEISDKLPPRARHIDTVILTAPHEPNALALAEVLDRYTVGAILTNGQPSEEGWYQALLGQIEAKNIPLVTATAGYTLRTDDGVTLEILAPFTLPEAEADIETTGLVLRLTYGEAVFLLMGESNAEVETLLLENPHLIQATVLQVPNHASNDASSSPFLAVVQPQTAIIQLDPTTDPNPTVIHRLEDTQLFRTDEHGTVEVVTDGQTLWLYTD